MVNAMQFDRPTRRAVLAAGLVLMAGRNAAAQAQAMPVVTSFSILADLVREVGGARIAVSSLVPVGTDLHMFQPKPSDARAIGTARVFVINGLGLEGWAERLAQSSGFKGKGVVATKGVKALPAAHNHRHNDGHGHAHTGAWDPHAWQDVANTRTYVANIRDGLAAADPAGAADYTTRAAAYIARLDALDQEIRAQLRAVPRSARRIVTTHEAFNYYGDAYDVDFLAPAGLSSEGEPSAKEFAALIGQIKREKIRALFLEQGTSPRLLEQLARETGVRIGGTLYADTLSPPGGAAPSYIEMMRSNTRAIVAALAT